MKEADEHERELEALRERLTRLSEASLRVNESLDPDTVLFAQGLSYPEIAEARGNQPVTIRNAVYGIQDKLKIETKQELVVWAVRNGLLDE